MVHLEQYKALEFLEKVGVVDGEALLSQDPLAFVNALIRAFMTHIPFQSVSLLALAKEKRHVPTLEEVVEAGLSLEGGLCFTINTFMCILLRTLGLDAHVLDGSYTASHSPHNHVVVLVRHLRFLGDDHFIDVGGGLPFMEAVAISSLPVTFHQAGLEYKYCRMGDLIVRLNRTGDHKPDGEQAVMVGDWRQVFHFTLSPVDYDFFHPYMEAVYVDEESNFIKFMRAARYPPAELLLEGDATAHKEDSSPHMEVLSIEKAGSVKGINTMKKANDSSLQNANLGDREEFQAFFVDTVTAVDEIKSLGCDIEPENPNGGRILVLMRNQSLLLGPMNAVVKTKVSVEDWANKLKHFFPTISLAKVDLAVQRMLATSTLS